MADIHITLMGTTHTTVFIRQVKSEVRSIVKSLSDERGRLSKDKLTAGRPKFRAAVDEGLTYTVIHKDCPDIWPNLKRMVFRALNLEAKGVVGEAETMMGMITMLQGYIGTNTPPDWDVILEDAKTGRPTCSGWCEELLEWVKANGGGGGRSAGPGSFRF